VHDGIRCLDGQKGHPGALGAQPLPPLVIPNGAAMNARVCRASSQTRSSDTEASADLCCRILQRRAKSRMRAPVVVSSSFLAKSGHHRCSASRWNSRRTLAAARRAVVMLAIQRCVASRTQSMHRHCVASRGFTEMTLGHATSHGASVAWRATAPPRKVLVLSLASRSRCAERKKVVENIK